MMVSHHTTSQIAIVIVRLSNRKLYEMTPPVLLTLTLSLWPLLPLCQCRYFYRHHH